MALNISVSYRIDVIIAVPFIHASVVLCSEFKPFFKCCLKEIVTIWSTLHKVVLQSVTCCLQNHFAGVDSSLLQNDLLHVILKLHCQIFGGSREAFGQGTAKFFLKKDHKNI